MIPDIRDYDRLIAAFRWTIPARYNIGVDVCDRWARAEPDRPAILDVTADGRVDVLTYGGLREQSNRLANVLARRGVRRDDRVAVLLPQGAAIPIAHVAIYKLGAVALPLAVLFGADALSFRLKDAGVRALVTNAAGVEKVGPLRSDLPDLSLVLSADGPDGEVLGLSAALERASPDFAPADTGPDHPALIIYTSGTTGQPKGALHGHRVVLGHLPGVQMPHEFLPQPGDRLWTPADWAWAGGLLNILLPGLHFGVPVVARKFEKFDPEAALRLMADLKVRNTFIPPTALRMLRTVGNPRGRFDLDLRTVASGGEALGAETFAWGQEALGLTINEFYGQTDTLSLLRGDRLAKPGAWRPLPGHTVAVIRDDGTVCEPDELGPDRGAASRSGDVPVLLEQARRDDATSSSAIG